MTDHEKILEKLAKIKAHQESAAKIGSEAEAQAFAEMLQKLLLKHKLAMSDIDFERHEKDEPIEEIYVNWQDVQVRKVRVAWIEQLASLIARAHFCRILVVPKSSHIVLVGRISDVKVAEYMLVVLTRTIEKLSKAAYYEFWFANHKGSGHGSPEAKGFKGSWITAFIMRLAQRFNEERKATETSSSTALVRLNTADAAVADYMKGRFKKAAAIVRGSRGDHNAEGYRRGYAAANAINLSGKAVSQGAGQKSLR